MTSGAKGDSVDVIAVLELPASTPSTYRESRFPERTPARK
jgi:hypothetical protein